MTLTRIFCSCAVCAVIFHVRTIFEWKKEEIFSRSSLCLNSIVTWKQKRMCTQGWLIYPLEYFVVIVYCKTYKKTHNGEKRWQCKNMMGKEKEKRCSKVNNKLCWRFLFVLSSTSIHVYMGTNSILFRQGCSLFEYENIRKVDVLTTEFKFDQIWMSMSCEWNMPCKSWSMNSELVICRL